MLGFIKKPKGDRGGAAPLPSSPSPPLPSSNTFRRSTRSFPALRPPESARYDKSDEDPSSGSAPVPGKAKPWQRRRESASATANTLPRRRSSRQRLALDLSLPPTLHSLFRRLFTHSSSSSTREPPHSASASSVTADEHPIRRSYSEPDMSGNAPRRSGRLSTSVARRQASPLHSTSNPPAADEPTSSASSSRPASARRVSSPHTSTSQPQPSQSAPWPDSSREPRQSRRLSVASLVLSSSGPAAGPIPSGSRDLGEDKDDNARAGEALARRSTPSPPVDTARASSRGHGSEGSEQTGSGGSGVADRESRSSASSSASEGRQYTLSAVQTPVRAAEFRSNILARLPVAPPLVLRLEVHNTRGDEVDITEELPFFICHTSLRTASGEEPVDLVQDSGAAEDSAPVRMLYGTLVSSPHALELDIGGSGTPRAGVFFVFPDLSVRLKGTYTLEASLFRIARPGATQTMGPGSPPSSTLATLRTEAFEVQEEATYVAPQPTALTQALAGQGLRMVLPRSLTPTAGAGPSSGSAAGGSPHPPAEE